MTAQMIENAALNNFYPSREGKEKIEEFYKKGFERKKWVVDDFRCQLWFLDLSFDEPTESVNSRTYHND
jgi:hypothetical protein